MNGNLLMGWVDQSVAVALKFARPDLSAREAADAVIAEVERIRRPIQGNRVSASPMSEADWRAMVEGTLRRCLELLAATDAGAREERT